MYRKLRSSLAAANSLGYSSFHQISGALRVARVFTIGLSGIGLSLGIALWLAAYSGAASSPLIGAV